MWPYDYINPMIPYFEGAKQVAANVPQPGERGDYAADFSQIEEIPMNASLHTPARRSGVLLIL